VGKSHGDERRGDTRSDVVRRLGNCVVDIVREPLGPPLPSADVAIGCASSTDALVVARITYVENWRLYRISQRWRLIEV